MKSKETKINIEVNIFGTRFSVVVPFSRQDAVRATETEMKTYLQELREKHSRKNITECMAMMAYNYASQYFALKAQQETDASEAEDLLKAATMMLGEEEREESRPNREEYGEF